MARGRRRAARRGLFASQREEAETSAALLKLVDAVAVHQELDQLLETVVQTTAQLLGRRRGALFLMDPTAAVLIPAKAWGFAARDEAVFRRLRRAARIRAVVKAIQSQEPVVVEDARVERSLPRRMVRTLDLRSVLIMPLTGGGRVMGLLAVDTPGEAHVFWPKEITLARGIATYAAVAIADAGLFAEKIQHGEARLRAVMDHVPDGIVTFDAQGVIESINPARLPEGARVIDPSVGPRDVSLARLLADGAVVPALEACVGRVRTPESSLRIWVGAPNLRISLTTPVDPADWADVLSEVVALGVGIGRGFGGIAASGTGEQPLVH